MRFITLADQVVGASMEALPLRTKKSIKGSISSRIESYREKQPLRKEILILEHLYLVHIEDVGGFTYHVCALRGRRGLSRSASNVDEARGS